MIGAYGDTSFLLRLLAEFRAYDVAHVPCALLLRCEAFWSFDAKASRLAELKGLAVL